MLTTGVTSLLLLLLTSVACEEASTPAPVRDADVGNWTVGDCIMAQFAMDLTMHLPNG